MFQASFGPASFGLRTTTRIFRTVDCSYMYILAIGPGNDSLRGVLVQVIVYGRP